MGRQVAVADGATRGVYSVVIYSDNSCRPPWIQVVSSYVVYLYMYVAL